MAGKPRVVVTGPPVERQDEVQMAAALEFVAELQRRFGPTRNQLLTRCRERRAEAERSGRLDFFPDTRHVPEDVGLRASRARLCLQRHSTDRPATPPR